MKILRYAVSLLVTLLKIGLSLVLAVVTMILVANLWMILTAQPRTIDVGSLADQPRRLVERVGSDAPPILVLGAGVINNEEPSRVLALRLEAAWQVHQALPDAPLVMSGDHREDNYNEVAVMKDYLVQKGVPSTQIYLDHAGYSTYESLYRLSLIHI